MRRRTSTSVTLGTTAVVGSLVLLTGCGAADMTKQASPFANAQGANGFRPWFAPSTINNESAYFFIKDLSSPARYEMKAVISPLSVVGGDFPDIPKQIREQGALGYRLLKERFLTDTDGKSPSFFLYMKDLTQASTFEYEFPETNNTVFGLEENNVIQANEQTAAGLRYFGNPDAPIFFHSLNCAIARICSATW